MGGSDLDALKSSGPLLPRALDPVLLRPTSPPQSPSIGLAAVPLGSGLTSSALLVLGPWSCPSSDDIVIINDMYEA